MDLLPYALVAAFGLAMVVIAITRRGKNLIEALPPVSGEVILHEGDLEFTERPRQTALIVSQVYARGGFRLTSHRLILTQRGFGSRTSVVRFVLHLRTPAVDPSGWRDGVVTFVVDLEASGVDEAGTLRFVPRQDPMNLPLWVGVRGELKPILEHLEFLRAEAKAASR